MKISDYSLTVRINGKDIPEYSSDDGQLWVEGRVGTEYSLYFRNSSFGKVLFIPSIDGLSVMDGTSASEDSGGYIVDPNSTLKLDGWRVDNSTVGAFKFASIGKDYASQIDQGGNQGVIGGLVFEQKSLVKGVTYIYTTYEYPFWQYHPQHQPVFTTLSTSASLQEDSTNVMARIGTGWGAAKPSNVSVTQFDRKDEVKAYFSIRYDTKKGLEKRGIRLVKEQQVTVPNPFPAANNGYCMPPKGWSK